LSGHVAKELQFVQVDDMLRERDNIHCSLTTERTMVNPVGAVVAVVDIPMSGAFLRTPRMVMWMTEISLVKRSGLT
jgi:hypothetical protein